MRIQHNIMAMNAYRNYSNNTKSLSKNLEKLSSGYKINRAGDDAAGLAISEKMRAQITGLEAAQKNVKDGISMVNTAEGAMQEVQDMLNRMVYLAQQSANGTYDNEVDRKNLQKEVDSLRSEINRIADSANFNGIKLMDGSMTKTDGLVIGRLTPSVSAAEQTAALGTISTVVDGKLIAGDSGAKYQASFYLGEITNSDTANAKKLTFTYNDASGAAKTIEVEVAAGKTATTEQIANALKGTNTTGVVTGTDKATTAVSKDTANGNVAKDGKFAELYDVSVSGNIITITAKYQTGDTVTGDKGTIATGKLGTVSVTNDFAAADVKKATDKIKEDFAGAGGDGTAIAFGGAAKEPTANVDPKDASYRVASLKLTLTGTGKDMHNQGIKVGDTTYVIRSGGKELKGVPSDATIINVADNDAITAVGEKLAAAITASEATNGGYVAKNAAGVITISESTRYAQNVLTDNGADPTLPGKNGNFVEQVKFTTKAATSTLAGSITVNAGELSNGTKLTFGDKEYMLTNDDSMPTSSASVKKILFDPGASNADIATKIANQLTTDGFVGVTSNGAVVSFSGTDVAESTISAASSGRNLQIGDSSDSYNQLAVSIKDMHTKAMGIDKIDISSQAGAAAAVDVIKNAINYVSAIRGDLGAISNRLDHTSNNLSVMRENIQDAESTIRDTDVAEEMMSYTKNNILVQSAQAMLAQANQVPQGVLQLLQ